MHNVTETWIILSLQIMHGKGIHETRGFWASVGQGQVSCRTGTPKNCKNSPQPADTGRI